MWRKCVLLVALIASLELQGRLGSDINYEYWSLIAVKQFLRIVSPKEKTPHMCSSIAAFAWDKIKLKVNFYHIKFYKEVKFGFHLKAKKERKFLQNLPHKCNLLLSLEYSKIYLSFTPGFNSLLTFLCHLTIKAKRENSMNRH